MILAIRAPCRPAQSGCIVPLRCCACAAGRGRPHHSRQPHRSAPPMGRRGNSCLWHPISEGITITWRIKRSPYGPHQICWQTNCGAFDTRPTRMATFGLGRWRGDSPHLQGGPDGSGSPEAVVDEAAAHSAFAGSDSACDGWNARRGFRRQLVRLDSNQSPSHKTSVPQARSCVWGTVVFRRLSTPPAS
jgi:hypothetical protein